MNELTHILFLPCRLAQHRDLDQLTTLSANELLSVALGGGSGPLVVTMVTLSFLVRVCLIWLFFFLLSVAERTYKQVSVCSQNILTDVFRLSQSDIEIGYLSNISQKKHYYYQILLC